MVDKQACGLRIIDRAVLDMCKRLFEAPPPALHDAGVVGLEV